MSKADSGCDRYSIDFGFFISDGIVALIADPAFDQTISRPPI
jgi:hypothetical protein